MCFIELRLLIIFRERPCWPTKVRTIHHMHKQTTVNTTKPHKQQYITQVSTSTRKQQPRWGQYTTCGLPWSSSRAGCTAPWPWRPCRRRGSSERDEWGQHSWGHCKFIVFWQRDFLGINLSKYVNRAYLFPQSVNDPYFCSDPISVDPSCPLMQYNGI